MGMTHGSASSQLRPQRRWSAAGLRATLHRAIIIRCLLRIEKLAGQPRQAPALSHARELARYKSAGEQPE